MIGQQLVRAWAPVIRQGAQSRAVSVIAGPPRVKISFAEKFATGIVMTAGWLFIPAWVLVHLQEYKGH